MSDKRRNTKRAAASQRPRHRPVIRITQYKVTQEPVLDSCILDLPVSERTRVLDLIEELRETVFSSPQEAIARVERAISEYPAIPTFDNFLLAACKKSGQSSRANELVVEQYKKRPDYLFAKLNYAEFLMERGRLDEVPAIFDKCFDLATLYPSRDVFHISEVTAFMGTVGAYLCRCGNTTPAKVCLDVLKDLAPDHPQVERLKDLLEGGWTSRALRLVRSWR